MHRVLNYLNEQQMWFLLRYLHKRVHIKEVLAHLFSTLGEEALSWREMRLLCGWYSFWILISSRKATVLMITVGFVSTVNCVCVFCECEKRMLPFR